MRTSVEFAYEGQRGRGGVDRASNEAEILEVGRNGSPGARLGGADRHGPVLPTRLLDVVAAGAIAVAVVIAIAHGQLGSSIPAEPSGRQHQPGVVAAIHSLPGAPSSWKLLALSGQSEVEVDLAVGSISETPSLPPPVEDTAVGRNDVRPLLVDETGVSGKAVMTDHTIVLLRGAASTSPVVLRGPEPDDVWVAGPGHQMRLVGLKGRPSGPVITLPRDVRLSAVLPDGAGYLLVTSAGGTYAMRPGVRRLVTHGRLLAVGSDGWLARECHARACRVVFARGDDGARRALSIPVPRGLGIGLIAPDGRHVAFHAHSRSGARVVVTVALGTGLTTGVGVVPAGEQGDDPGAWSPDGRYLFVSEADGGLAVQDTKLGTTRQLALFMQPLVDLTLRSTSPTTFDSVVDDRACSWPSTASSPQRRPSLLPRAGSARRPCRDNAIRRHPAGP